MNKKKFIPVVNEVAPDDNDQEPQIPVASDKRIEQYVINGRRDGKTVRLKVTRNIVTGQRTYETIIP